MRRRTFLFLGAGVLANGALASPRLRSQAQTQQPVYIPPRQNPRPSPPSGGGVLNPLADLTYLGVLRLPVSGAMGSRFGYSNAALACRVVGDDVQLMISQASPEVPGGSDSVGLVRYTGPNTRGDLIANLGDVSKGRKLTKTSNPRVVRGMYWDSEGARLWIAYGDTYNVAGIHDPSLVQCAIAGNSNDGVTAYGPYRTPSHSQRTRGYIHGLPSEVVTALGGKRIGVGAPSTSGVANSPYGAWCSAFAPPADSVAGASVDDTKPSFEEKILIASDQNHRNPRPADTALCGWTHYNDPVAQNLAPQANPVQDGTGCNIEGKICGVFLEPPATTFNGLDMLTAAAWVDGPRVSGLVHIGQLCRTIPGHDYGALSNGMNHKWYGPFQNQSGRPVCPHGQKDSGYLYSTGDATGTMMCSLFVTPREQLLAVAQGADPFKVTLSGDGGTDMSKLPTARGVSPISQVANGLYFFGGAAFCRERQLLFVCERNGEAANGEYQPIVHVIEVTANLR